MTTQYFALSPSYNTAMDGQQQNSASVCENLQSVILPSRNFQLSSNL